MKIRRLGFIIFLIICLSLYGCNYTDNNSIRITNGVQLTIEVGDTLQLNTQKTPGVSGDEVWLTSNDCVSVTENGLVTAVSEGVCVVSVVVGTYSYYTTITVTEAQEIELTLSADALSTTINGQVALITHLMSAEYQDEVEYVFKSGRDLVTIQGNIFTAIAVGTVTVAARIDGVISNYIEIVISSNPVTPTDIELSTSTNTLTVGAEATLSYVVTPQDAVGDVVYEIISGSSYIEISGDTVKGLVVGNATIVAKIDGLTSNAVTITVSHQVITPRSIALSASDNALTVGEEALLTYTLTPANATGSVTYEITSGSSYVQLVGNKVKAIGAGTVVVVAKIGTLRSNGVTITIANEIVADPYVNMSNRQFYSNYTSASSYLDSYYRTLHNFMSGSIASQDQEPTISEYRPMQNGLYLRNSRSYYSSDGNTYGVVDAYGDVVVEVYKGGAYVILEEVAAYVFAFGEIPANYVSKKSGSPTSSVWGEYLRVNHSYFSGDTSQYPYEPVLPDIDGCGGDLKYYEMDIGTTGTDCDPKYVTEVYNNGSYITRGAARIVYTRFDANGDKIIDINEKFLFYTYNHYNDFQEYLNYYGGWGEIFGNITGGGEISSRTDYNPTDYVRVVMSDFGVLNAKVSYFCDIDILQVKANILCELIFNTVCTTIQCDMATLTKDNHSYLT